MDKAGLLEIIDRYLSGNATPEEETIVKNYYDSFQQQNSWQQEELGPEDVVKNNVIMRIREEIRQQQIPLNVPFRKRILNYAAAAAVLGILATGALFLYNRKDPQPVFTESRHDIAPGKDGAILTLADGSCIVLDTLQNGFVARQGNVQVFLQNGQLAYNPATTVTGNTPVVFNTMSTPRGRQFTFQLPDGSKVWLNAASSVTYPTAFTGADRKVTVTGEVYFEVVPDKNKPFRVNTGSQVTEVLGTTFNVNAYAEEEGQRITLIEGKVRVSTVSDGQTIVLAPGEQALIGTGSNTLTKKQVQTEEVVAWKTGYFQFADADIHQIMRQAARWYDAEIHFEGKITTERFRGKVSRNLQLSELMKVLEANGVNYRLENRVVTILP